MLTIEKDRNMFGMYDAQFLRQRYGVTNFVRIGNRYVAIKRKSRRPLEIDCVTVRTVTEKSLVQKHMEMQMGRVPRPQVRNERWRVVPLSEEEIQCHRYEVYREV